MKSVEIIGPPGSGKTTLFRTAAAFFTKSPRVLSTEEAFFIGMRRDTFHPLSKTILNSIPPILGRKLAKRLFRWTPVHRHYTQRFLRSREDIADIITRAQDLGNIPDIHRRKVEEWFSEFAGYYEFFEEHLDQDFCVFFDEGFTQKAVNLFVTPGEEPPWTLVDSYIERVPRLKLLINVDADRDTCMERISTQKRGRIRLRDMDSRQIEGFIDSSIAVCRYVVDGIQTKHQADSIIHVDNNGPIHESKGHLRDRLESIFL